MPHTTSSTSLQKMRTKAAQEKSFEMPLRSLSSSLHQPHFFCSRINSVYRAPKYGQIHMILYLLLFIILFLNRGSQIQIPNTILIEDSNGVAMGAAPKLFWCSIKYSYKPVHNKTHTYLQTLEQTVQVFKRFVQAKVQARKHSLNEE